MGLGLRPEVRFTSRGYEPSDLKKAACARMSANAAATDASVSWPSKSM
jgi:hypothetical protein